MLIRSDALDPHVILDHRFGDGGNEAFGYWTLP